MKYFLSYSKEEMQEFTLAKTMVENEMWSTTYEEALKGTKCNGLLGNLYGLQIASQINQTTLHHFTANFKIKEEFFKNLVDLANTSKIQRELLDKSRIH